MNSSTTPSKTPAPFTTPARDRRRRTRGGLPPGFDPAAWTWQACERSGVTVAVTDPVALGKLRTLTRPTE